METIYTVASNSSTVTYGNIAQHAKEMIKNIFPNNFFNYETISTEIAYRNIRRQLGANTRKELKKRKKPYLIIRPVFTVPDEMYLYGIPLTTNMDHIEKSISKNNLFPIIQDTERGIGLSYKLNRDRIEFQVTVVVSTLYQQLDIYKLMANSVFWMRPFTVRKPLEAMIPRSIMETLAQAHDMDINNEKYAAGPFLEYLNRYSTYPITYKMRTGTSKDEYFIYSNQEVLFSYDNLQINEGNRKNMADDSFELSFTLSAEFNIPGIYVMFGSTSMKEKIGERINGIMLADNDNLTFPLFTMENLFGDQVDPYGFRKFRSSILQMEPDQNNVDVTNFGPLLSDEIVSIIRSYCTNHVGIETIARIALFKDNQALIQGQDYNIDWYHTKITTLNPDKHASYRLIIYLNSIKVNELLIETTDVSSVDRPGLRLN